jgi:type VI protein secretion system component Hcp
MADSPFDAYMYFVGEGQYYVGKGDNKKLKPVGMVKGESLDDRFRKQGAIKILSFGWSSGSGQEQSSSDEKAPTTLQQGLQGEILKRKLRSLGYKSKTNSDRLDARANVGAIRVTKEIDVATPTLFLAHAQVAVFKGLHVHFRKMGAGKPMTFCRVSFSDVIITDWDCDFSGDYKESLTMTFDWCQVAYYPQSKEGTKKKDVANTTAKPPPISSMKPRRK